MNFSVDKSWVTFTGNEIPYNLKKAFEIKSFLLGFGFFFFLMLINWKIFDDFFNILFFYNLMNFCTDK